MTPVPFRAGSFGGGIEMMTRQRTRRLAYGAAMAGLRPVVELYMVDFVAVAFDLPEPAPVEVPGTPAPIPAPAPTARPAANWKKAPSTSADVCRSIHRAACSAVIR